MIERTAYILILLGLFILSGIGLYFGNSENIPWANWITEKGRWILIPVNLLFLVLAFRQLFVWNIQVVEHKIKLTRCLGLKKLVLHETDFISFTVELDKDPWWMKRRRTTIVLRLQTTKGKLIFNSSDYKSFDTILSLLFSQNKEMRLTCSRQISWLKTKSGF